jgi:hypothetical protein
VREWVPYNGYSAPELVGAKSCQWSVPTVKRLWFGTTIGINRSTNTFRISLNDFTLKKMICIQCCGSGMFIPDPIFFHPGSKSKNLSILPKKMVSTL